MRLMALASAALLLVATLPTWTLSAQARQGRGAGTVTYAPVTMDMMELADGTVLQRSHQQGVVIASDTTVPFHLSPQDCFGANLLSADGALLKGSGYCDGVDRDGHVWWIWWKNAPSGNTWGFLGGTGKYEGMEGGGTTTPLLQGADGRLVITWTGSWRMR